MSLEGRLKINGRDAYATWGAYLLDGGVSALMAPPPMKPLITNTSRLQHGKRVTRTDSAGNSLARMADRDLTLGVAIRGGSRDEVNARHAAFVRELQRGVVRMEVREAPGTVFRLDYQNCTEFSHYGRLAKYALRFNEPDPGDRGGAM